jgi:hypothetical protein
MTDVSKILSGQNFNERRRMTIKLPSTTQSTDLKDGPTNQVKTTTNVEGGYKH